MEHYSEGSARLVHVSSLVIVDEVWPVCIDYSVMGAYSMTVNFA